MYRTLTLVTLLSLPCVRTPGDHNCSCLASSHGHEDLVPARRGSARRGAAGNDENPLSHRGRAETMPRRRDRCPRGPRVARGIVRIDTIEGAGRGLTTKHEQSAGQRSSRDSTPWRRHGSAFTPAARRGVILLVHGDVSTVVAIQAPADRVETAA